MTKKRRTTIWLAPDEHEYLVHLSAGEMRRAAGGLNALLQLLRRHDIESLSQLNQKLRTEHAEGDD